MGNRPVELNRKGLATILRSEGVRADLERRAKAIAAQAGEGFIVDSEIGHERARAAVIAHTHVARHAEATERSLTRALDAGRL